MSQSQTPEIHISLKVDDSQTIGFKVSESENVNLAVREQERIKVHLSEQQGGGTNDYQRLVNKPKINGEELFENYNETDPTVPSWAKAETKPTYTYDETGAVGAENELHFSEIDRMFSAVFGI